MSNTMNNLFAAENNYNVGTGRGLSGTAQLTNLASEITAKIITVMNSDTESYAADIKASQADNTAMDNLIERVHPLADVDVEFLKELDETVIEGMLKSQQSKRSRCKTKAMTLDNYKALMTGAVAENLIRLATGKEKHSGGYRRAAGSIEFTVEELETLSMDQDKLRKEIRNIQSKKSIMKSKADFNESDERWQQLLKVEQQLKDMRVATGGVEYVMVDETKNKLNEILNGVDPNELHAKDSKELLARIASLIGGETTEEN